MKAKTDRVEFRIAASLKGSFESAAAFNHQSLSQFLVQAGIAAVESARSKGLAIKAPSTPRDGRKKK